EDIILATTGIHLSRNNNVNISGIILSGGLVPHQEVIELVKNAGIPMILTKGHTYSVAATLHDLIVKIKPRDKEKIANAISLIEENIDIERLVSEL
ncbi:MAG: DRTGG domain-containing protein, partial [Candidatus Omnitrophota bacterium]